MWEGVPLSSEALGEAFPRKLLLLVGFPTVTLRLYTDGPVVME